MFRFLKTLKNRGRQYLFGNRGVWNRNRTTRTPNGMNTRRTRLGRLKNRVGLAMFGSRAPGGRTILGKGKNWIEKRLGLNKSRNNTRKLAQQRAAFAELAREEL